MKINNKLIIIAGLAVAVVVSAAATSAPKPKEETSEFVNLKVLPKNISSKDLKKIMIDDFEDGLGVGCNFCHAQGKEVGELDFASDAKPEKNIARIMMRMTIGVNKKYLKIKHAMIGAEGLVVTCNTCHNGVPFPDGKGGK